MGEPGSAGADGRLLERTGELAAVEHAVARARAGRGGVLLVEGPAGIGKTTLLAAARDAAGSAGMAVLAARGSELERELALGVARQLFERAIYGDNANEFLAGPAAVAGAVLGNAGEPPHSDLTVSHGLFWLASNLAATRPLFVAVDDAHWADSASLRFFEYLARRVDDLPICVVLAARPAGSDRNTALAALPAERLARVVELPSLSEAAGRTLVTDVFPAAAPEFAAACHAASGGNPLYLRELLAALAAEGVEPRAATAAYAARVGPASVAGSVRARIERLGDGPVALASAVAVLGVASPLRHAAALAELDAREAGAHADRLCAAGILAPAPPLDFAHPVVRNAVYGDVPPYERAARHARAARLLAADGATAQAVAAHLLHAEPEGDTWVVEQLRAAAGEALAGGAAGTAAAYLERALREPPAESERPALTLQLAGAELQLNPAAAGEHAREAAALAAGPDERADAVAILARALAMSGRLGEAVGELVAAVDALPEQESERALKLEAQLMSTAQLDVSSRDVVASRLASALERADRGQSPAERMLLANAALESALALEPAERVADLARRALAGGRLLEQVGPAEPPFTFAAMTLMLADRLQEADSVLASGLDWAREHGDAFGYAVVSCFKAHVAYRLGDIPESEALVRRGLELAEENGWTLGLISMRGFLVDAAIERGELDGAERALAEVGAEHEIPDSAAALNLLLESRGRLRLAQGRIDEAIADLLTCGERQERWRSTNPATATWRSSAALGLAQTGRRSEALELAEDELALARRFGAPRGIGRALRVLGVVRGGDDGIADAKEAVDVLSRSEARLEHAAALADLGSLLRASGRRKAARQPLRDALDGATRCGATALAARARDELLAAGGRPRRAYVTGVEALTPSERRIARMAADGLSNREIAQALFLTVRTVESHLGNAYTKLGIATRTELADALVDRPAAVTDAA